MNNIDLFEILAITVLVCFGVLFFYGAIKDAKESMRKLHLSMKKQRKGIRISMNVKVHDKGPFTRSLQ